MPFLFFSPEDVGSLAHIIWHYVGVSFFTLIIWYIIFCYFKQREYIAQTQQGFFRFFLLNIKLYFYLVAIFFIAMVMVTFVGLSSGFINNLLYPLYLSPVFAIPLYLVIRILVFFNNDFICRNKLRENY